MLCRPFLGDSLKDALFSTTPSLSNSQTTYLKLLFFHNTKQNQEVLLAHPGHGGHEGGYTIIHYFIEPMHAVVTIGCIVAVIAFVRMSRKKSKQ